MKRIQRIGAFKKLLALGLTQAECLEVLHDHGEKFMSYAANVATNDELEVDDKPLFSLSEGGVWVGAWVFVHDKEV